MIEAVEAKKVGGPRFILTPCKFVQAIDDTYDYTPKPFKNGDVTNPAGTNAVRPTLLDFTRKLQIDVKPPFLPFSELIFNQWLGLLQAPLPRHPSRLTTRFVARPFRYVVVHI